MSSREHYIINTFFLSLHAVFHHYINIEHEATFFITSSATFFQKSVPFSVCAVNSSYKVEYYESEDGLNWIFIDYADIPQYIYYNGANRNCWHIDVQKTWLGRKYYALITYASGAGGATPSYLFWGESDDGLHWTVYDEPILSPVAGTWQSTHIYRSTLIIEDSTIKVWYSARADDGTWHTGYTEAIIDFVDPNDVTLNVVDVRPKEGIPERILARPEVVVAMVIVMVSAVVIYWKRKLIAEALGKLAKRVRGVR